MGDDSTPRRVLSLARGRENMYWVRQNKGGDYRVNESHILSLKRSRNEGPHRHGDVLNIEVRDWLKKGPKFRSRTTKATKWPVEFAEPGRCRSTHISWACGSVMARSRSTPASQRPGRGNQLTT